MTASYKCPRCHEPVLVKEHNEQVKCGNCRALLAVNHDADYVAGQWVDRTKLTVFSVALNK